jgi:hypothetical protein
MYVINLETRANSLCLYEPDSANPQIRITTQSSPSIMQIEGSTVDFDSPGAERTTAI